MKGDRPKRTLAEVLDEVQLHAELEEFQAVDSAAQDRELAAAGYDAERTRKTIEAARQAADAAHATRPPAKVVDFQAARAKRGAFTRWAPFAAAAAVALAVGGTGYRWVFPGLPADTSTVATVRPPPPSQLLAAASRKAAFRLCDLHYLRSARTVSTRRRRSIRKARALTR